MTNRPDPMHPDVPVKFPVPVRECTVCGGKFVPVSEKGTGSTHCPACRKKITEKAREKSLEMRRAAKAESDRPAFTTTLEWYRPADKLPEKSQKVFFISDSGASVDSVNYSKSHNAFNARDGYEPQSAFPVSYWAYIPADLQEQMDACWLEYCNKRMEDK